VIIEKIEIEAFGGLKHYSLSLAAGLQYLYGENEAGKSTLCAFLRAMMYGFPKGRISGRDERKLYMPWGESKMSGSLYFQVDGTSYLLKRKFGKTARGDVTTLFLADTWQELPLPMEEIGEHFLGVGADAFEKTLFMRQLGVAVEKGKEDEVMMRLTNLESAGDEDISLQKATEELERAQHELITKTGRGGAIMQLDAEIEELKQELSTAEEKRLAFRDLLEEMKRLTAECEAAEQRKADLQKEREQAKAYEQFALRQKERDARQKAEQQLETEQNRLLQIEKELEGIKACMQKLESVKELDADILVELAQKEATAQAAGRSAETRRQLQDELQQLEETYCQTENALKPHTNPVLLIVGALVGVLGLVCGFALSAAFLALLFVAAILIAIAVVGAGKGKKARAELEELTVKRAEKQAQLATLERQHPAGQQEALQAEIQAILSRTGVQSIAELSAKIKEFGALSAKQEPLQKEKERQKAYIDEVTKQLEQMQRPPAEEPVQYSGPDAETLAKTLERLQSEQLEKQKLLAQKQAMYENGFADSRSMAVIQEELTAALEKREELFFSYRAVTLAKELLESCGEELKSGFTPALNAKAGALIEKLTDGRYLAAKVTDTYTIMLQASAENEIVDSGFVSAGTFDLIYFALRLAVLKTLFGEIPLLILDDTFIQLDKKRRQAAFSVLADEANTQILYFSCHEPPEDCQTGKLIQLKNYNERVLIQKG